MSESSLSTQRQGLDDFDESSSSAGMDATRPDGFLELILWHSDTGSDAWTSGIGLGWDSTWDKDTLTGRCVKLVAWSASG